MNRIAAILSFLTILLLAPAGARSQTIFSTDNGIVRFTSDAPLELIQASSDKLRGLLEIEEGKFAFSVEIQSFVGFNNPLQQVHFNENYMESKLYPTASFAGKIIEDIDFTVPGVYEVRAKGNLKIHGEEGERIIQSKVVVDESSIQITSEFSVLLEDYSIRIPKIVHQKIAESISVEVRVSLSKE